MKPHICRQCQTELVVTLGLSDDGRHRRGYLSTGCCKCLRCDVWVCDCCWTDKELRATRVHVKWKHLGKVGEVFGRCYVNRLDADGFDAVQQQWLAAHGQSIYAH